MPVRAAMMRRRTSGSVGRGGGPGPNPTDRAKRGTKYNVAVDGDGVPVACVATAANVNDTLVFERLFLAAYAVMARIRTVFADKGYDAEHHRDLCRFFGVGAVVGVCAAQPPLDGGHLALTFIAGDVTVIPEVAS